ncbi:hypothetical protein ABK040_005873 [Willaertia magna]
MLKAKINDDCFEIYNDLKMSKGNYSKPFLVMKMENSTISINTELSNLNSFEELSQNLPDNHARFIFYHLEFEMPSDNQLCKEGKRSKMMLITWVPEQQQDKEETNNNLNNNHKLTKEEEENEKIQSNFTKTQPSFNNIQLINIDKIKRPVFPELDECKVESLMKTIEEDYSKIPPVEGLRAPNGDVYVFGGCHRYQAHKNLNLKQMKVNVRDATEMMMQLYLGASYQPNVKK